MVVYEGDPQRVASLLPGREYTPNSPLLHYTRKALRDDGWTVREHWWSRGQAMETEPAFLEAQEFVAAAGEPLLHLIVGKSLGCLAAQTAVERGLPAIWITPPLKEAVVRAALDQTLEPTLVIGGERDETWNRRVVSETRVQMHEVGGGDHWLEIPDSVRETLKAHEAVVKRIDDFIRGLEN